jgi:hypothetical protein
MSALTSHDSTGPSGLATPCSDHASGARSRDRPLGRQRRLPGAARLHADVGGDHGIGVLRPIVERVDQDRSPVDQAVALQFREVERVDDPPRASRLMGGRGPWVWGDGCRGADVQVSPRCSMARGLDRMSRPRRWRPARSKPCSWVHHLPRSRCRRESLRSPRPSSNARLQTRGASAARASGKRRSRMVPRVDGPVRKRHADNPRPGHLDRVREAPTPGGRTHLRNRWLECTQAGVR